jgi:hypothetical protein
MSDKDRRRREGATGLLTFLWGVQFTLVVLLLFGPAAVLSVGQYRMGPTAPDVLCSLTFLAGALMVIWLFAGRAWKRLPRAWRLDAAFGYMALLPTSAFVLFISVRQAGVSQLICLGGGAPITLAYVLLRVVPTLRRDGLDEEDFP